MASGKRLEGNPGAIGRKRRVTERIAGDCRHLTRCRTARWWHEPEIAAAAERTVEKQEASVV